MPDRTTLVSTLRENMARFVREREWEKFHSPKNLSMALAVEAAELMEHFLWIDEAASREVQNVRESLCQLNGRKRFGRVRPSNGVDLSLKGRLLRPQRSDATFRIRGREQRNLFELPEDQFEARFSADERARLQVLEPLHRPFCGRCEFEDGFVRLLAE